MFIYFCYLIFCPFFIGELEQVYITQPEGFVIHRKEKHGLQIEESLV